MTTDRRSNLDVQSRRRPDRIALKRKAMIRQYIAAAMAKAEYEILSDDGSFYGEIPGFQGVYSNADTLEECRAELEDVLDEWLLFSISRNFDVPTVDGLELKFREYA